MTRALIRSLIVGLKRVLPLAVRLNILATLVPRQLWFPMAAALSRVQGRVSSVGSPESAEWARAMALDWWLYELTWRGEYPVRCRAVGLEVVKAAVERRGGTLLCGTHIPYMRVVMRVLLDHGVPVSFVVAAPEQITAEGRWLPTGWPKGLQPIVQGPETLMQMRSHLRNGELGGIMMDRDVGGAFYPNGMRLAGKIGARVVLTWVEMAADGRFTVTFMEAPHPVPDTEEKVSANLAVLEEQRTRILGALQYVVQTCNDSEQGQEVNAKAHELGEAL